MTEKSFEATERGVCPGGRSEAVKKNPRDGGLDGGIQVERREKIQTKKKKERRKYQVDLQVFTRKRGKGELLEYLQSASAGKLGDSAIKLQKKTTAGVS